MAECIVEKLKPIREKRKYYQDHPEIVEKILIDGTKKAREITKQTLKLVKQKMFLDYFEK